MSSKFLDGKKTKQTFVAKLYTKKKKEKGRKLVFLRLIGKPCRLWGVRDPGKKAKKEFSGRTGQSEDVSQHQRTSALYIGACAMELGLSFVFSPFFPLIFFPLFRSSSYQFFFFFFSAHFFSFFNFFFPFFPSCPAAVVRFRSRKRNAQGSRSGASTIANHGVRYSSELLCLPRPTQFLWSIETLARSLTAASGGGRKRYDQPMAGSPFAGSEETKR